MQISHFHRWENFITLYWFRNNSLTSSTSFSLHINLSLFKALSCLHCLQWGVLYCRPLKDCVLHIQLGHLWLKKTSPFSPPMWGMFGYSEVSELEQFHNPMHKPFCIVFWIFTNFYTCVHWFFFFLSNQVSINVDRYAVVVSLLPWTSDWSKWEAKGNECF